MNSLLTEYELEGFSCSEKLYCYSPRVFPRCFITDGIKYLAANGECYWLLDAIAAHQYKLRKIYFQVWILTNRSPSAKGESVLDWYPMPRGNGVMLTCWDDTPNRGTRPYVAQRISFTDFPLKEIKLYVSTDEERSVIMLPNEY